MNSIFILVVVVLLGQAFAKKELFHKDVKYIKCPMCEMHIEETYDYLMGLPKDELMEYDELAMQELVVEFCNPKKDHGKWLTDIDIVVRKRKLILLDQETELGGKCNKECNTLERACDEVMGEIGTDLAERLVPFKKSYRINAKKYARDYHTDIPTEIPSKASLIEAHCEEYCVPERHPKMSKKYAKKRKAENEEFEPNMPESSHIDKEEREEGKEEEGKEEEGKEEEGKEEEGKEEGEGGEEEAEEEKVNDEDGEARNDSSEPQDEPQVKDEL